MTKTVIKPSPGRNMLYVLTNATAGFAGDGGQEFGCIVGSVDKHDDTRVNVCVFDANGVPHAKHAVKLVQEGESAPSGDHCKWMPYQQGQAKKPDFDAADMLARIAALEQALLPKHASMPPSMADEPDTQAPKAAPRKPAVKAKPATKKA